MDHVAQNDTNNLIATQGFATTLHEADVII